MNALLGSLKEKYSVESLETTELSEVKIEGTFSFVGKEVKEDETCDGGTKNVTNGSFRLVL